MNISKLFRYTLLVLVLCLPLAVSASEQIDDGQVMVDSGGNTISLSDVSAVGGSIESSGAEIEPISYPPSNISSADFVTLYETAMALLKTGTDFRLCRLQMQTGDNDCPDSETGISDEAKLSSYYADFNNGILLNDYCLSFAIDERGYCPDEQGLHIRNNLMQARRLFASLYLVRNDAQTFEVNGQPSIIKEVGLAGMLDTTRELAYAHMIFGSEYAIDAFDYAFTISGLAGSAACEAAIAQYAQNISRPNDPENGYFTEQYFDDADCIIQRELQLLEEARMQYEMAINIMISAYHEDLSWPASLVIGELFNQEEVQVFAVAIENYAAIVDEIAMRNRQLGDDSTASTIYEEAYDYLFLLSMPLLERAGELHTVADDQLKELLGSNGLAVRSSIELMTDRLQEIENGTNALGFLADLVPIQSFQHMHESSNELLEWAEGEFNNPNTGAIATTRQFEINSDQLIAEMRQIRTTYESELVNLCGPKDANNNFDECIGSAGSLMEQSWLSLVSASLTMNLANRRIEAAYERIADIQAQNTQVINVRYQTSQEISVLTLAQGMARAYQTTESTSNSISDEVFEEQSTTIQTVTKPGLFTPIPDNLDDVVVGTPVDTDVAGETVTKVVDLAPLAGAAIGAAIKGKVGAKIGEKVGGVVTKLSNSFFGSTERTLIENETKGRRHSETKVNSVTTVFNPSEIEIAELENTKAMLLLAQDVTISGIEVEFQIRDILRQIAELQIEKEQAANRYNQAASEHNGLVNRWLYVKAQYRRANEDLNANYLASPAFRLLRDSATEKANYNLLYAAKQAYLTAKALEYQFADTVPFINDVFKVRHPSHLKAYLHLLDSLGDVTDIAGENQPEFSLRVLVSGIRDQDISSAPADERAALTQLRDERFQAYLDEHIVKDANGQPEKLILVFDTSLENRPINAATRHHWRIAGAKTGSTTQSTRCPVLGDYGVTVAIDEGNQTLPNGMTVELTMAGQGSTRKSNGDIVQYSPRLVTLLPREYLPESVYDSLAETSIDATIDVNNPQNAVSDFCNMSVANSTWILEIQLAENQIDYKLFRDIKLKMWTFYYS